MSSHLNLYLWIKNEADERSEEKKENKELNPMEVFRWWTIAIVSLQNINFEAIYIIEMMASSNYKLHSPMILLKLYVNT